MIPNVWTGIVLALAAFRVTRLIGWDDLPPIARVRAWATGERVYSKPMRGENVDVYQHDRPLLSHFLHCAFCQGFWTASVVYGAWLAAGSPGHAEPRSWVFYALVPFALSAAVGLVARNLDP